MPPVVVIASRSAQDLSQRTQDVSVIDRTQIENSGLASLGELLLQQHGIELVSSGGPQGTTGLMIRGSNPAHTLVLIDGLRIGSSTAGGASLNAVPLQQVERIEILRGPASSLYGASAIGGVINIITRRDDSGTRFNALAGIGSYGNQQLQAGVSGRLSTVDYSLQLGRERSDGFSSISRADPGNPWDSYNPDDDGFQRDSLSARLGWQWSPGHTVATQWLYSELDGQFDGVSFYDDREQVRISAVSLSSEDRLSERWQSRLSLGQTIDDSTTDYGGFRYRYRTRQLQASWLNDVRLGAPGLLTLGLERLQEEISAGYIGGPVPDGRDTNSAIAVYQWQGGAHSVQLNLHYDHSSQYGGEASGAASWGYRLLPALRLAASVGSAFHAPTFNDLYYPGYGRSSIQPERSFNRELGLYFNQRGTDASLVAFYNQVDDLIAVQIPCDTPGFDYGCAANVRDARLRGVSLGWQQQWGQTRVRLDSDWQQAEDSDSGRKLPRRANWHGTLALSHQWQRLTLGSEVQGSSHRFEDSANSQRLAGYGVVNAYASWQLLDDWSLLLRVNNVADRDYELAHRYGTGGRTAFVALRWEH